MRRTCSVVLWSSRSPPGTRTLLPSRPKARSSSGSPETFAPRGQVLDEPAAAGPDHRPLLRGVNEPSSAAGGGPRSEVRRDGGRAARLPWRPATDPPGAGADGVEPEGRGARRPVDQVGPPVPI